MSVALPVSVLLAVPPVAAVLRHGPVHPLTVTVSAVTITGLVTPTVTPPGRGESGGTSADSSPGAGGSCGRGSRSPADPPCPLPVLRPATCLTRPVSRQALRPVCHPETRLVTLGRLLICFRSWCHLT